MTTSSPKVTLNDEQKLYVIPCGEGFTCYGYQNCFEQVLELSMRLSMDPPDEADLGTLEMYNRYRELLDHVAKNNINLGTWYGLKTPLAVRHVLESARRSGSRIRIFLGDKDTGRCWNDEYDVIGRVGRSTGILKSPLMISRRNSTGGGAILCDCIIRIQAVYDKRVLYQHPRFAMSKFEIVPATSDDYLSGVNVDGMLHAQFKKPGQAERWVAFMTGQRMSK